MRIQHNIMAMNAYRNYNTNVSAMKSNLEKLSSGYKINRAGDDAAGLAISEKMRAQITGLNAAQKNVKDGISLVQTAEGAMQEVQDMLNRMVYLATQSANGTYDDEVDRANLQKELDQLTSEINRIADSANFNGIKLLDGSKAAEFVATKSLNFDAVTALTAASLAATAANGTIGTNTIEFKDGASAIKTKFEIDTSDITWSADAANDTLAIAVGNIKVTLTATQAGAQDIDALLKAAVSGTVTSQKLNTGKADFTVGYADGKITIEMTAAPDATTDAADLDPSQTVTVTASAGTGNHQWNAGSLVMTRGQKPVDGTPANTVITAANLGIQGTNQDDGFTLEIDGKKFVIAVGDDSDFASATGATVVKVDATDDAEKVMEKLANAINAGGTVWSAGTNAAGALTLAQTDTSDADKNAVFKTVAGIASTIKTGKATVVTSQPTETEANAKPLTFQIGDTADTFNQLKVKIGDIHAAALGIDAGSISIATQDAAASAIQKIKDAINTVSSIRGDLGATQNRLEHTANNLSVMTENIQDAESTIRDTDVAEEMMSYTKNNILIQAAQAMLAQANQVPQGVLQLLQ